MGHYFLDTQYLAMVGLVLLPGALGQQQLGAGLETGRLIPGARLGHRIVEVNPSVRRLVLGPILWIVRHH